MLKKHILTLLVTLFIIIEALACVLYFSIAKGKESAILDKHVSIFKAQYETVINSYKKLAYLFLHEIIDDSKALEIFAKAHNSDDETKDWIRKELYTELRNTYQRLESLNLRQLHFHMPNNESFLRFHAPDKYGDNLTEIRESVRLTNKHKTEITGFEEGRIFNGFRFVFPLFDKSGTHIGSVETSLSYFAIKDDIENRVNSFVSFIISKEEVESKVFDDHKSFYVPAVLSELYVAERELATMSPKNSFSRALLNSIKEKIKDRAASKLRDKEEFALAANVEGTTYIVSFVPIEDVRGKKAAAYLISYSEEKLFGSIEDEYLISISVISALNALIFFLIYLVIKRDRELELKRSTLDEANKKLSQKYEMEHKEKIEQENIFRLITESTFDAIITINEDSEIITWNSAAEAIYGYMAAEALGRRINDIIFKCELPGGLSLIVSGGFWKHKNEMYGKYFELNDLKKDGSIFTLELLISHLESGQKQFAVLIGRDVTDKKRLEEQRESAQNMLIQQSKMASMGEMIGVIGHQWKQPLNIVMLHCDVISDAILDEPANSKSIEKATETIKTQVRFMSQTIDDFRNFFKPSQIESNFEPLREIE